MSFEQIIPRSFTPGAVRAYAPLVSGIYGISNSRQWIFIGETDNIQGSLLGHLQDSKALVMEQSPTGFVFEVCDQSRRPARHASLLVEYAPVCNRRSSMSNRSWK